MSAPFELERFLLDLGVRRRRLVDLAGPDATQSELVDELQELGEQLIVADEELRVQHEELTSARQALESLAKERDQLLHSSTEPHVVTDSRGVVLRVNRAAAELLRQPTGRRSPRPIATWFEVADRSTVRSLIGQLTRDGGREAAENVTVRRGDGSTVLVSIAVRVASEPGTDESVLRWDLRPHAAGTPRLQSVPDPQPADDTEVELASRLARLSGRLAECDTEDEVLQAAARQAVRLIPGAGEAAIAVLDRQGRLHLAASSGELSVAVHRLEADYREGPTLATLADRALTNLADTMAEARWPNFARRAAQSGVRSVLAVELGTGRGRVGTVTLYSSRANAFDDYAERVATLVADPVARTLSQLRAVRNLTVAMESRQLIGEAAGVLVERYRITSDHAFDMLVIGSQHNNVKLRELARLVVETGQDPRKLHSP